jgi:hypothetical protein
MRAFRLTIGLLLGFSAATVSCSKLVLSFVLYVLLPDG